MNVNFMEFLRLYIKNLIIEMVKESRNEKVEKIKEELKQMAEEIANEIVKNLKSEGITSPKDIEQNKEKINNIITKIIKKYLQTW